jgi:hypothetical protein
MKDCGMQEHHRLMLTNEKDVYIYQMLVARKAITLEEAGMQHSRLRHKGGARRVWALHLGLPPKATHGEVRAKLTEEINRLKKERDDEFANRPV